MDEFAAIADGLRHAVLAHYDRRDEPLQGVAGLKTLETNSGLASARADLLLGLLDDVAPGYDLRDKRVLDIGCGFGSLAVLLASRGAKVTAVDPNHERMEVGQTVAEDFGLPIRWVTAWTQELPLADRSFDLVMANNSLCYIVPRPERVQSLVHLWRVLDHGGRVVMRNPNRTTPLDPFTGLPLISRLPPRAAVRAARLAGRHRSLVRLHSARGQRAELARVGFEDIVIRPGGRSRLGTAGRWASRYHHIHARKPARPGTEAN